jgi:hypothetical protein
MFERTEKTATAAVRGGWGLLLALALTGCGRVGQVSGKVSYRDQPVPDGTVMLLASDGRVYDGQIQADSTFAIAAVPAGVAKVSVTSMTLAGQAEKTGLGQKDTRGSRHMAATGLARSRLPMKYSDFDQSGLTVTVEKGQTATLDLRLK